MSSKQLIKITKKKSNSSSQEILALFDSIWGSQYHSPAKMVDVGKDMLKNSIEISFLKGQAYGKLLTGTGLFFSSAQENPLIELLDAAQIFEGLKDLSGHSKALSIIGNVYENYGEYTEALTACQKSMKLMRLLKDQEGVANVLGTIANIYIRLIDYPNAIHKITQSLAIRTKLDNKKAIASCLNLLGRVHSLSNNFPLASKYYFEALALRKSMDDQNGIPWSYLGIASMYELQGNLDQSIHYFELGIEQSRKTNDRRNTLHSLLGLGKVMNRKNKPAEAIRYLKEAQEIAESINAKSILVEIHDHIAKSYELKKEYRIALDHSQKNRFLREELLNEASSNRLRNKMIAFEVENYKKETEIFRLKNVDLKQALIKIKDEQLKNEKLLLNILPLQTAQELKRTGKARPRLFPQISVLFSDFVGFTAIAEKLPPRELVAEIDECFSAFDAIMQKHGVEKIKTIGDAYMAACGLPKRNPKHASHLTKAALEMIQFMNEQKRTKGNNAFEIRIGINSGPVVAGIVGRKKFAYDIWGDTVNIAARLESASQTGKLNVSKMTRELIKDEFKFIPRGKINVKGKEALEMFFVESKRKHE